MAANKKVFICDDDDDVLTSIKRLLELSGFEVMATKKPQEVMSMVPAFQPDVILLDLMMPEIGGLDLCEMLNKTEGVRNIPIIIISVLADQIDIKRAYKMGVIGYFTKPYEFKDLLREIDKAINFKRGDRA